MAYVINEGIKIHYQTAGDTAKSPIIFTHGNGNCLDDWFHLGYVDTLKDKFFLIMIDLRGFGQSDKPYNSNQYHVDLICSDVIAVLDELNISKAHYFGNSRGGSLGFAIAKRHLQRFHSLILASAQPFGCEAEQLSDEFDEWLSHGIEYFVDKLENTLQINLSERHKHNFLANDAEAMRALNRAQVQWPNDSDCFKNSNIPRLLIYGEHDPLANLNRQYLDLDPKCTIVDLKGYSHSDAYRDGEGLAKHITEFVSNVDYKN